MFQLRETHFDKLDASDIPYTDEVKLLKILAIFDVESISVDVEEFRDTEITTRVGKQFPISASVSASFRKSFFPLGN